MYSLLATREKEMPKYEYIDPTARFMGIVTPGRCEQKHIYDVKLNCKVFSDPYEDYIRFLETKHDYMPSSRERNYYRQLGMIRLGKAVEHQRARSVGRSREKHGPTSVEEEICASIDRVSRLRRDWKLLAADSISRLDLNADQLLFKLLDDKGKLGIDHHEFCKILRRFRIEAEPEQVDSAFKLIDQTKDDVIDACDIKKLLSMKQLSSNEIRYGPTKPLGGRNAGVPLTEDFIVPFVHLLKCILCIGENIRSIRLGLTQLGLETRLMTQAELQRTLGDFSHQHHVYKDDLSFIAAHFF